jgi:hypothetical protein
LVANSKKRVIYQRTGTFFFFCASVFFFFFVCFVCFVSFSSSLFASLMSNKLEFSSPSGFHKTTTGVKSNNVDALLHEGKNLIMMKNAQSKMQVALDGLLSRLLVQVEDKPKEKKRGFFLKKNFFF